jgi:2'-5' RNA ligase
MIMIQDHYLAIICPEFSAKDYEWIQDWRRKHDAVLAEQVLPHFTLVFPVGGWSLREFSQEVHARLSDMKSFEIALTNAAVRHDKITGDEIDALVPGVGAVELNKLHAALYAGEFASEAQPDLVYHSHLTIGRSKDAEAAYKRISELNKIGVAIRCLATSINIVSYKNDRVRQLERIALE